MKHFRDVLKELITIQKEKNKIIKYIIELLPQTNEEAKANNINGRMAETTELDIENEEYIVHLLYSKKFEFKQVATSEIAESKIQTIILIPNNQILTDMGNSEKLVFLQQENLKILGFCAH